MLKTKLEYEKLLSLDDTKVGLITVNRYVMNFQRIGMENTIQT